MSVQHWGGVKCWLGPLGAIHQYIILNYRKNLVCRCIIIIVSGKNNPVLNMYCFQPKHGLDQPLLHSGFFFLGFDLFLTEVLISLANYVNLKQEPGNNTAAFISCMGEKTSTVATRGHHTALKESSSRKRTEFLEVPASARTYIKVCWKGDCITPHCPVFWMLPAAWKSRTGAVSC